MTSAPNANAGLIWSVAELLRGDYKQSDYGKVVLPFSLLRRLDCVLAPTKAAVLAQTEKRKDTHGLAFFLNKAAGHSFYNTSRYDFATLLGDANNLRANLLDYLNGFSPNVRDIFERYDFDKQLAKLDGANLLYQVVKRFAAIDLSPANVRNEHMGAMFEELIRRFAELSNETAGEHFTPREVIKLMVNLVFNADDDALNLPGAVRSLYDPAAGTGGMLTVAEEHLRSMNPQARLSIFGQELNEESYATKKRHRRHQSDQAAEVSFDCIIIANITRMHRRRIENQCELRGSSSWNHRQNDPCPSFPKADNAVSSRFIANNVDFIVFQCKDYYATTNDPVCQGQLLSHL